MAYPEDNFPTHFIDQILDECVGSDIFSFMDEFLEYNHVQIKLEDEHKTSFICPFGTFSYRKMPFYLKNNGATFHQDITFSFHDLKHIIEFCLDDLPSHSQLRVYHLDHLHLVFERCHRYQIWLNPKMCISFVGDGWLLGFIVSKDNIRIDSPNFDAIVRLYVPCAITHL